MAIRIKRAEKYGFCSGVRVADIKVRRFAQGGGKAAILGQVVHNERVVADLERLGVRTVQRMEEATEPVIVFSAHGVPPSFHERARKLGLQILDTTCKFVYDIHKEAARALAAGMHLVFIGEPHHREVIGYTHDLDPTCYHVIHSLEQAQAVDWSQYPALKILYQTTLNAEDFEDVVRYIEAQNPHTQRADTICYATKENQDAARKLAQDPEVDLILVIGGKNSANTRHLFEICQRLKPTYLIQGAENLRPEWFTNVTCVGITAGASTPDYVVDEVEAAIGQLVEAKAS
ncbi:MAG: 4-hydroxy-3-methylbut-2-enyl diphosphate reductase [Thermoanaerobaculum sp.]|nr:4-hydroxy-3-methylbut-2-enyl diphosphate reductase [Thermoanaerobaculum sp.]MDW7967561.1 4-hydroxy-3-methylbut-2-enyl diphosphate reductase [Thermoanaerobaculum sp.]